MSQDKHDSLEQTPSAAPKLRLNKEKVRVLNVRTSLRTGKPGAPPPPDTACLGTH